MRARFLTDDISLKECFDHSLREDCEQSELSAKFRWYYGLVRPWLPRAVRRKLQGTRKIEAGKHWFEPREFFASLTAAMESQPSPPVMIHPWPNGAALAMSISHDVETADGFNRMLEIAEVEESLGYKSSFNVVPYLYQVDFGVIRELHDRGFEVGVHGYNHDGRLFTSEKLFQKRVPEIQRAVREFEAVGFRSPMVHRNLSWLQQLHVEYDASYFDVDPYQAMPGGVGGIWPFIVGDLVELPYTLPQDHTLWIARGEKGCDTWRQKMRYLADRNGMALMLTHPDYTNTAERLAWYRDFLYEAKEEYQDAWLALPREVAQWWRERDATELIQLNDGNWQITGPAASRAEIATWQLTGQTTGCIPQFSKCEANDSAVRINTTSEFQTELS